MLLYSSKVLHSSNSTSLPTCLSAATSVIVTGHSLGGALATLCAVDVQYNFSSKAALSVYTFGAPRVGNHGFRESFNRRVPASDRFFYGMDLVPALPRPWQGYSHVNQEYRFGPRFSFNFLSQRLEDHKIANYIAALKVLATTSVCWLRRLNVGMAQSLLSVTTYLGS